MDVRDYNRGAWDKQVEQGNPWTVPVTSEQVEAARRGEWSVVLTERRPVPREWFPELRGRDVLCLASGGGQQGPILAAAGANVTVYDNSPRQLARDREVADRDGLAIRTVEGDMRNLEALDAESFDLVFHPVSNCFVDEVRPVWREAFRVLRPGGVLLAGFLNPVMYVFDLEAADRGDLVARHKLPYSDVDDATDEERQRLVERGDAFEFSHSVTDQIGGQLDAGFHLVGLYEDTHEAFLPGQYFPTYLATRAVKPG